MICMIKNYIFFSLSYGFDEKLILPLKKTIRIEQVAFITFIYTIFPYFFLFEYQSHDVNERE